MESGMERTSGQSKTKVYFFFPWKEISGGPVYLSALADDLAEEGDYDVCYIDYEHGLSDKLLHHERVAKIPYKTPFSLADKGPIILVTPIYCAMHIPELPPDARILFVNWHNFCMDALASAWRLSPEMLTEFLGMVSRTDSEIFLDRTHWLAQDKWAGAGSRVPERYVPVKGRKSRFHCKYAMVKENELHVACLGRLCKDKIYSVLDLIEQLERASCPRKLHLHVIGDGEERDLLKARIQTSTLSIHMEGIITGEELQKFLAENVDILFSMGLSILEGAALALPSVVMPHNVIPFHADSYVYFQDCSDGAVGWYDTQLAELGYPIHTMDEVLHELCADGGKERLGQAALEHLNLCHSSNIKPFKQALLATTLSYRELRLFDKKQRKIRLLGVPIARFSSSFDGREKTISLLGIKNFLTYRQEEDRKDLMILGKPVRWLITEKNGNQYRLYLRIPFVKV